MRSYPTASPNCVCQQCGASFRQKPSRIAAGKGRFCSHACADVKGNRRRETPVARFWAMVNKNGPIPEACPELGPCHLWTGADNGHGYGVFWDGKRHTYAHRFALELAGRPLLPGQDASHLCHNKGCARESHLVPEAHPENVKRSKAAGRLKWGADHAMRLDPGKIARGEQRYWTSKLTAGQVAEIRARYQAGGISQARLGGEFGVSQGAVWMIVHGKNWQEV